jgi:hypothetical protein
MRNVPPERMLALLVAFLLLLMGAGLLTMYRVGPPRGQLYARLHQPH